MRAAVRRTVALGATALGALARHRQHQRLERLAMGPRWTEHGFVFASMEGGPFNEKRVRAGFARMLTRAGLAHIRFHDLRHTHATLMLLSGVPIHVVAARLGDDPATVLRNYAHLLPSSQREAADKFEAVIGG